MDFERLGLTSLVHPHPAYCGEMYPLTLLEPQLSFLVQDKEHKHSQARSESGHWRMLHRNL